MTRRRAIRERSGPAKSHTRRWVLLSLLAGMTLIGLLALATGWLAVVPLAYASRALAARDEQQAERWLSWAQRLDFRCAEAEFLAARIARRAGRLDECSAICGRPRTWGATASGFAEKSCWSWRPTANWKVSKAN